jgi:hypothetical protein
VTSISWCVAEAVFLLASDKKAKPIYVGGDALKGCCGGGTTYLGFTERAPNIRYFVSYGTKEFRNGAAEYLRATPELVDENARLTGRYIAPGKYLVVSPCANLPEEDPGVRSILLFGEAEQVRNLCSLVHFHSANPFDELLAPSGPSCASFITYAAGIAEKAPRNTAYLGPFDPTGNRWFPPDLLSLAIPIDLARRMHEDLPESFLTKRVRVAFPLARTRIK